MTEKRMSFRDKIGRNTKKQRESKKSFGYLNLPKDLKTLTIPEDMREIELDFLPYEVTDTNHPDKDLQYDVATKGSLWYRRPFKVHKNVGIGEESENIICPRSIGKGKACPICEHREKRAKEGADKEEIKELYGKSRSLYVAIPFNIKGYEEVPTVWDVSTYLFQDVLNDEMELDEANRDFPSLEEGKTAVMKLKWKAYKKGGYHEVRNISFEKREPYDEAILDEVPNLDELFKVLDYKEIEDKFFELDGEEDGGALEEIDETPSIRKRKTIKEDEKDLDEHKTSRRSRVAKEEEPEKEEKEEKEEEEKEEAPKKERTSRRSSRVEKEDGAPKGKCPYGHVFGQDEGKFKDCDECDIWKSCAEAAV